MRRRRLATIQAALFLLACHTVDYGAGREGDPPRPATDEAPASRRCGVEYRLDEGSPRGFVPGQHAIVVRDHGRDSSPSLAVEVIGGDR